jgi:hypothetical protein
VTDDAADLERRFGGLRACTAMPAYAAPARAARGRGRRGRRGSWTAEALARCGVAELTLIDLDHVAESNINRQVQALGRTLGQPRCGAGRAHRRHPSGLPVQVVDDFVHEGQLAGLLPVPVDAADRRLRPGARQAGAGEPGPAEGCPSSAWARRAASACPTG